MIIYSQLVAMRQKSSCSLATSKVESRDSVSALSLPSAAVERLGLEAWRRIEPEEMQLGTYGGAGGIEFDGTHTIKDEIRSHVIATTCRVVLTSLL